MILASLLLIASTLHAGPERAITTPVRDASPSSQFVVAAAAGDHGVALVVWHEHFFQFAAARIDREGRRLDERPIALAAGSDTARGDGGWLVAGTRGDRILAQLVRDDGTTGEVIELAQSEDVFENAREVRVAFDGTHYLVVWNVQHAFEAARLDASGRIVEQGISFDAPGGEYRELDVTTVDGRFAVVTLHFDPSKSEYTVEVFRLDGNANLVSYRWLDRTSTAVLSNLKVTADGSTIVAAWRAVGIGTDNVFVAREGEPLRIIASNSTPLDITRIGGTVYVVLTENSDVGDNTLVSETGTREWTWPSLVYGMAAASFGDRALLVAEAKPEETNLYTTVLDAALEQVAPVELLGLEPALQERPSIARAANGQSLVVWVESGHGDGPRIAAARIDGAGRTRDPQPIIIAAGLPLPFTARPQVATDGEEWLVVWSTGGEVRSQRVLRDGTLAGPPVAAAASYDGLDQVCVAWNGREYLAGYVAVTDLPDIPAAVFMVPISRDNVPGSPARLSGAGPGGRVVCAAAGSDTFFGWLSGATIVRTDGTTSGPLAITDLVAVASDGERFAVVRYRFDGFDDRYKFERAIVSRQGTVSLVNEPLIAGENPALAATQDGFILAWDSESPSSTSPEDVYVLLMDQEGRAVGAPVALAATALREQQAALAGGDVPIAVYMKEVPSPLERRYRIFARTLGDTGPRRRAVGR